MAKKFIAFRAGETEVKFFDGEAKRTNTNITTVIKKLIRNAMEGEKRKDQIETLEAKLETLEKISLRVAESAIFAEHMAITNYMELVQDNEEKIEKAKSVVSELTEADMNETQE